MLKKPRPRFLMLSFSLVAVLMLILSACGGGGSSSSSNTSASTPVKGGTWTDDLYEEPDSLLPNGSVETFSDMVDTALYAPLFLGDVKGKINPGIVTEMPTAANGGISADLKTWPFHLKPGHKWSDGQLAPLPAHVFSSMDPAKIETSKENLNPSVVSGPFTLSESVAGDHYTLV